MTTDKVKEVVDLVCETIERDLRGDYINWLLERAPNRTDMQPIVQKLSLKELQQAYKASTNFYKENYFG